MLARMLCHLCPFQAQRDVSRSAFSAAHPVGTPSGTSCHPESRPHPQFCMRKLWCCCSGDRVSAQRPSHAHGFAGLLYSEILTDAEEVTVACTPRVPFTCWPQRQHRAEGRSFLHHGAVTRLPCAPRVVLPAGSVVAAVTPRGLLVTEHGVGTEHGSRQACVARLSVRVPMLRSSGREQPGGGGGGYTQMGNGKSRSHPGLAPQLPTWLPQQQLLTVSLTTLPRNAWGILCSQRHCLCDEDGTVAGTCGQPRGVSLLASL